MKSEHLLEDGVDRWMICIFSKKL